MNHKSSFRVYYEDTDAGGVVYYANYLKFAERARTELLRDKGVIQSELATTGGILFVVRRAEMDLKKPAKLDDMIDIETIVDKISGASIVMNQKILTKGNVIANIKVQIACVNGSMKPTRLSPRIKSLLS